MTERSIALTAIRLDGGTQCRAVLDTDYIATLAEAWVDGAKMPAVVVYHDGSNYWLADGFHRYHAAQKCDFRDILAEVRSGTRLDAVKAALSANAQHGLRRTNADKRRAVEIALKEFPKLSDREIGRICAVNHEMVATRRPQLAESASSTPRTGADGKTRKLPARTSAATVKQTPAASLGFTVRDLGGGVLVKEPVSKSEAYVAENGTVRRMSAAEEEDDGDDVPSAEEIRSTPPTHRVIGNDQPPPMTNCERWALLAKIQLEKITSQPRGNPDRAAALKNIREWLDENE